MLFEIVVETRKDSVLMLAENQEWADRLARSLSEWLKKNGYAHMGGKKEFANEHGIDPTVFGRITRAQVISDSVEYYARIYLVTGLAEANPTQVPSKRVITRGREVRIEKKWSHDQYRQWVMAQAKGSGPKEWTPPSEEQVAEALAVGQRELDEAMDAIGRPRASAPAGPSMGSLFEQMIQLAMPQLAAAVAEHLSGKPDSLNALLEKLTAELQRYYSGTRADRDRLAKEHGRGLAALLPLLEPLTLNSDARENALRIATMTDRSL